MYNTKQKQEILNFLVSCIGTPLSISEIHEHLKASGSNIGMATIYRNIDKLCSEGLVRKHFVKDDDIAHYEYVDKNNNAICFQCDSCGKTTRINCHDFIETANHMHKDHGVIINTAKTVLYGLCNACSKENSRR